MELAGVALTSLVGRDDLLGSLAGAVRRGTRLISLSGAGGVGKTRLALELVHHVADEFDLSAVVYLADLNPGEDATTAIGQSIVTALGVTDHQSRRGAVEVLLDHLQGKRVLLVLDNAEHLLDPVADMVIALLTEVPQLSVVTTTRHRLDLPPERVVAVPPVTIPEANATPEQARGSQAVELLLDRAAATGSPAIPESGAAWDAVVELARWSGGLPLVIELIAAQMSVLGPEKTLQRLDGGRLLATRTRRAQPHHRTLTRALDVSWDLCSPEQRRLWARLAVFSGGFDLEAAEEVCGDGGGDEVLALLADLVRHSVVVVGGDGRYQQLQPLRGYGLRHLDAFGETDALREKHCHWVRRLVATCAVEWFGPDELTWLARIHRELPNIRAAVNWCVATRTVQIGLGIVADVVRTRVHFFAALQSTVRAWADDLLSVEPAEPTQPRMAAHAALAFTLIAIGDKERGDYHLDQCRAVAQRLGIESAPPVLFAEGLHLVLSRGDTAGLALLRQARDGFRAIGAPGDGQMAALLLSVGAGLLGATEIADAASADCLADAERHNSPWARTWALWTHGLPALSQPKYVLHECLPALIEMGDRWGCTWTIEASAWWRARIGEPEDAARLLGGCIGLHQRHGVGLSGLVPFQRQREQAERRIVAAIGEAAFRAAYTDGTRLATEEVYDLALRPFDTSESEDVRTGVIASPLTAAERKVAELVAAGLSNGRIAEELYVSKRTVETHVGRMLAKLHFTNRTQLATWYGNRGSSHR
ncbi:LuxR C-terminal-related transcriptional regulator [Allokutzneria sp. A3M-2-11 16]|uniref:ATP-binding protein n=1 Tax=Allokutzneria sp. A3M-2-11 16 TaxID=2962043 RepID=UPI0020B73CFB|nr:LuxR C-terminal-related transcriptional regulator [Allokutzneria sp. A3M-2-11 16]MCP3805100.1 LuxR C-terminal-related transcriptional regulator [Allokutzneria sp. A3M-2-11 16]